MDLDQGACDAVVEFGLTYVRIRYWPGTDNHRAHRLVLQQITGKLLSMHGRVPLFMLLDRAEPIRGSRDP